MMEGMLYEIMKMVLPAVITGIVSFGVAKYTYHNGRPLDKLEIAYNRVYYPLYRLISKNDNADNIESIIGITKLYIDKYEKYIDKSTIRAYDLLCKCDSSKTQKEAYKSFKENIFENNSYIRRRLGYLEPSLKKLYAYSSVSQKFLVRFVFDIFVIYVSIVMCASFKGLIQTIFSAVCLIAIIAIIIEIVIMFIRFLCKKIKMVMLNLWKHVKHK